MPTKDINDEYSYQFYSWEMISFESNEIIFKAKFNKIKIFEYVENENGTITITKYIQQLSDVKKRYYKVIIPPYINGKVVISICVMHSNL